MLYKVDNMPNNRLQRSNSVIGLYLFSSFHVNVFEKFSMLHYENAYNHIMETIVRVPAQFFFSKVDPIGTETGSLNIINYWKELGIKV